MSFLNRTKPTLTTAQAQNQGQAQWTITNTKRKPTLRANETTATQDAQRPNQHQTRANIKAKRNHHQAGRERTTQDGDHRKGETQPPQTRHGQNQRRHNTHKVPNRNRPQTIGSIQGAIDSIGCTHPRPLAQVFGEANAGDALCQERFASDLRQKKTNSMRGRVVSYAP